MQMGNSKQRTRLFLTGCLSLVMAATGVTPLSVHAPFGVKQANAGSESLIRISQSGPGAHRRVARAGPSTGQIG